MVNDKICPNSTANQQLINTNSPSLQPQRSRQNQHGIKLQVQRQNTFNNLGTYLAKLPLSSRGAFRLRMHLFTDDQDVHIRQQILTVSLMMWYVETIVRYSLR